MNNSFINPDEWQFEFQQRNSHPILMADFWCRSLCQNFEQEINLPVGCFDHLFTSNSRGYTKKKQKENILKKLDRAAKDDKYIDYVYETTQERIFKLEQFATNTLKKIKNGVDREELALLWEDFDKSLLKIIPWFYIPWYIIEENIISDKVENGLLKYKKEIEKITDFNNATMLLMFPTKELLFQQEQKDFYKLVKIAQENKDFKKSIEFKKESEKYLSKHAWIKTFILLPIEPLTQEELVQKIKSALKDNSSEEYILQQKQKVKNGELVKQLIEILKKDKELLSHIEYARELSWLLTASVEQVLFSFSQLIPFYKLIAKNIDVSYSRWIHLTSDEITKMLDKGKYVTQDEIESRELAYVFLMENSKRTLFTGEQAKSVIKSIDNNIEKIDLDITKIKGKPTSPGIVKGKVHIIMTAKDSHLIEQGEILVCSMTSPDYVPAMKKAVAIVTDEGGLLSHASIVSRELGKPCVVGTKIATKVLKDGDLVEVDADNGVVRIIK